MIRASLSRRTRRPLLLAAVVAAVLAFPASFVLASHQFADVPDSNPFHADIEALANSGVTTGCGGGNFCPDDFVTREQMAAFLNRLGLTPINGRAGHFGYAWADDPTSASYTPSTLYSYNSAGGPITITRSGTGVYRVTFEDLPLNNGNIQVTKYGAGAGICNVGSWGGSGVTVRCYDMTGDPADFLYTVTFVD
ncbi:MAG: S-layer homology domain-containing protein [Candidatus Limnocylindria bacterium]